MASPIMIIITALACADGFMAVDGAAWPGEHAAFLGAPPAVALRSWGQARVWAARETSAASHRGIRTPCLRPPAPAGAGMQRWCDGAMDRPRLCVAGVARSRHGVTALRASSSPLVDEFFATPIAASEDGVKIRLRLCLLRAPQVEDYTGPNKYEQVRVPCDSTPLPRAKCPRALRRVSAGRAGCAANPCGVRCLCFGCRWLGTLRAVGKGRASYPSPRADDVFCEDRHPWAGRVEIDDASARGFSAARALPGHAHTNIGGGRG